MKKVSMASWLLPDNVADILPRQARSLDRISHTVTELFESHGFEPVMPPVIEYTDSLLTGSASDLANNTFKFTDQANGRMLGIRADFTPQVARIDAHILGRTGVTRLCYNGFVAHQRPMHPLASRLPYVVGAEMFGASGHAADREMMRLAVESLRIAGVSRVHFDLGHVGVVRAVLEGSGLVGEDMHAVLRALRMKDQVALDEAAAGLSEETRAQLRLLTQTYGGLDVIDELKSKLPDLPGLYDALEEVRTLASECGADAVSVDFCDVHGYRYLTGVTFAAYVEGMSQPVLRGGRYDDVGRAFGRARPAVGFTLYLRELVSFGYHALPAAVVAPADDSEDLRNIINGLRMQGEIVVQLLPGEKADDLSDSFILDRALVREASQWVVKAADIRK